MNRIPPPADVLEAFRLTGDIAPTHTRDVWRVGSVALKRVEHHAAVERVSTLLANKKQPDSVRIPLPIASVDGEWIVDGWIPGERNGARWRDLLDTGAEFHDWLSEVERPAWIDQVDDPWRASDRMACR